MLFGGLIIDRPFQNAELLLIGSLSQQQHHHHAA